MAKSVNMKKVLRAGSSGPIPVVEGDGTEGLKSDRIQKRWMANDWPVPDSILIFNPLSSEKELSCS
jgi:hypothetical protein